MGVMMQLVTQNNKLLLEVISALQKHIRRNEEKQAMKCALELLPRYEKYFWRRLLVIVVEDIGPANPGLLQQIKTLRETYFEFRQEDKRGAEFLVLANAIVLMSRSPKCRIGDNFQAVCRKEWEAEGGVEIPDYALDCHTGRGRRMGRTKEFWIEEGLKLVPTPEYFDPYTKEAQAAWLAGWEGKLMPPMKKNGGNGEFEQGQGDLF